MDGRLRGQTDTDYFYFREEGGKNVMERATETGREEALALIAQAVAAIPQLTYAGVGVSKEHAVWRTGTAREVADGQKPLYENWREVAYAADWIRRHKRTRTIRRRMSSYGYKHMVERWAETYVSNGAFIAAAAGLGLRFHLEPGNPNPTFNLSVRSARKALKAHL